MRRCFVLFAFVASVSPLFGQELPTREGEEPLLEVEPALLIKERNPDGSFVLTGAAQPAVPDPDIAKLEKNLARAKRSAAGANGLFKAGIISKAEAEERELRAIRLEAKLAEARLQLAKRLTDEAAQPQIAAAEETAARAAAERRRAELDAALRHLQRQQKLLALGSGRKADVQRAEQKLVELQRAAE